MSKTLRTADRAFAVFEQVCVEPRPFGLSDISKTLGLDKATTLRMLTTLQELGYLRLDAQSKKYSPGERLFALRGQLSRDVGLMFHAHLERLSATVGETVCVAVPDGLRLVFTDAVMPASGPALPVAIGSSRPIYRGACGRVLTAYSDLADRQRVLSIRQFEASTPNAVTDKLEFLAIISRVRREGFAMARNEVTLNGAAVSVPIFDGDRRLLAAIEVKGPGDRMSAEKQRRILPVLQKCVEGINGELARC